MKRIIASVTIIAATFAAPTAALARSVKEFEDIAPRVENRTILQDVERVYPYEGPTTHEQYDPQSVNTMRGRNLDNHQETCKLIRRNVSHTSDSQCEYPSPWKGSGRITAPVGNGANLAPVK